MKYIFNWNQGIVFPILFALTVLTRWRAMAIFIGIFGFLYVTSTLEKFPSLLFIAGPFIAVAVRDNRPIWSKLVIGGLALSLLGPLAINQSAGVSTAIHKALNAVPPASATPGYDPSITTPAPGCEDFVAPPVVPFDWRNIPASLKDIVVRRIASCRLRRHTGGLLISHSTHFSTPPMGAVERARGGYRNPANPVGLWMYCGPRRLPTVSAYGSFIADGWGELGYRSGAWRDRHCAVRHRLRDHPWVRGQALLPCLLRPEHPPFATPAACGMVATIVSSGLWLIPVLCLLFLASEAFGAGAPARSRCSSTQGLRRCDWRA